jgi:hypothetical protein
VRVEQIDIKSPREMFDARVKPGSTQCSGAFQQSYKATRIFGFVRLARSIVVSVLKWIRVGLEEGPRWPRSGGVTRTLIPATARLSLFARPLRKIGSGRGGPLRGEGVARIKSREVGAFSGRALITMRHKERRKVR